jgi:hypothetical protein
MQRVGKQRRNASEQPLSRLAKEAAMAQRDLRDLTIRELGELAVQVRNLPVDSRDYKRAIEQMAIAALCLENSGALAQCLWWMGEVAP